MTRMFLSALAVAVLAAGAAQAAEVRAGDIVVAEAWARASVGAAPTGVAYLTLRNTGDSADKLIAAATDVARKAGLHTHIMDNGVMRMRPVEDMDLPPGKTVTLAPGGLHVMLMGLKAPLAEGGSFDLTLTFEKGGTVTVPVSILGIAARGPHAGRRPAR